MFLESKKEQNLTAEWIENINPYQYILTKKPQWIYKLKCGQLRLIMVHKICLYIDIYPQGLSSSDYPISFLWRNGKKINSKLVHHHTVLFMVHFSFWLGNHSKSVFAYIKRVRVQLIAAENKKTNHSFAGSHY